MNGVFLDLESIDKGDLQLQGLRTSLEFWKFYPYTESMQVIDAIANAEVVVANKIMINADTIAACPGIKLICIAATGVNNVDLPAAEAKGIAVCNARNYATPSVVQHTFALILSLITRLPEYQQAVRQGAWQHSRDFCLLDYPVQEIAGKVMGIIGYGVLGHAVAEVARAFEMKVLIAEHKGLPAREGRVGFDEVIKQSDVITVHAPLTEATRNLIGAMEFRMMKSTSLLINVARGGIVNETALVNALLNHDIAGAGIDVLTEEPPKTGNPLLAYTLPNLIVTPHIAWASRESRQRLIDEVEKNILAFRQRVPRNLVQ